MTAVSLLWTELIWLPWCHVKRHYMTFYMTEQSTRKRNIPIGHNLWRNSFIWVFMFRSWNMSKKTNWKSLDYFWENFASTKCRGNCQYYVHLGRHISTVFWHAIFRMLCKRLKVRLTVKLTIFPVISGRNEKITDNFWPEMAERIVGWLLDWLAEWLLDTPNLSLMSNKSILLKFELDLVGQWGRSRSERATSGIGERKGEDGAWHDLSFSLLDPARRPHAS